MPRVCNGQTTVFIGDWLMHRVPLTRYAAVATHTSLEIKLYHAKRCELLTIIQKYFKRKTVLSMKVEPAPWGAQEEIFYNNTKGSVAF